MRLLSEFSLRRKIVPSVWVQNLRLNHHCKLEWFHKLSGPIILRPLLTKAETCGIRALPFVVGTNSWQNLPNSYVWLTFVPNKHSYSTTLKHVYNGSQTSFIQDSPNPTLQILHSTCSIVGSLGYWIGCFLGMATRLDYALQQNWWCSTNQLQPSLIEHLIIQLDLNKQNNQCQTDNWNHEQRLRIHIYN